jgi:hypothetical protein
VIRADVAMTPRAVEDRLRACAERSRALDHSAPRVDMSAAAVEARLVEWAETSALCLDLAGRERPR